MTFAIIVNILQYKEIMKDKILNATISIFNDKGVKFTLDDIAKKLSISKKSIYKYFDGKEDIINQTIDMLFDDIERQQYRILELNDIDEAEKLRRIVLANPSMLQTYDDKLTKLIELYPDSYKRIKHHFEDKWDLTLSVLDKCRKANLIKNIPDEIFRTILLGIFDTAVESKDYTSTIEQCVNWVFEGIKVK